MAKHPIKAISTAFGKLSAIGSLRAEIALLTSCSSDTVYRLRYDTMQYDYISPAVINLLGYSAAELMQLNLRSLILETRIVTDGMKTVDSYTELEESRKRGEVQKWQADYLMKTKDGRKIWVSDISYPWFDKKGAIVGSNGSLRDITDRIVAEQKIRNELTKTDYSDTLTGLANLRNFWLRLEEEVRRTRRTNETISVMLIGINKLDEIKNTYDKKMAEDTIVTIAKLIRSNMREIDIVAHIDESVFGMVMPETSAEGASAAAKRLVKTIASHKFFASLSETNTPLVNISIGISGSESDKAADANLLYKQADAQLFVARHKGENQICAGELAEMAN
jgi:diguanylate cyclase (GGDEF)-like protein/PAS domain S-box-containing protein